MKFFKKKNLLNVLYAVLIALPLFSILGRVLYTQWNQNAKDSYNDNYIKSTSNVANPSMLIEYQSYIFNYNEYTTTEYLYTPYLTYKNINIDWSIYTQQDTSLVNSFRMRTNDNLIQLKTTNNTTINLFNVWGNTLFTFTIQYLSAEYNDTASFKNIDVYQIVYETNKLDNAFDYSISQFVSDNDFGKLNFFTWFSDLFLSNNSVNNLYIHFVNWYLNYTLYVSLGYILWLVLMWFVSFIRRLLEKTSTYETGGF